VLARQILASIESNESLNTYSLTAPISGVITQRNANPGEQTDGRQLFTIMNRSSVWASLALFPGDRSRVKVGAPVSIAPATGGAEMHATISRINVVADDDQSVKALVVLDNADEQFLPGTFVTAQITIGEHAVPLAVKRSGLQPFRDFTVVYAKIGEQYEVRMLDLGRQNDDWVEILGGLEAGTRYVSENSYVIKADIEKSGASHDH
jgi:cobalt-zinc-cadmium efflux system membrane fusion protein